MRKSKKIGKDKGIANKVAEKIKAKLILGDLNIEKASSTCPNFKQYAEMWMALPHDWKPATLEAYQNSLRLHIYPEFKNRRLNEIRRKDVKLFFDRLLTNGKKP